VQKIIASYTGEKGISDMWKAPVMAAIPADHPQLALIKQAVSEDHLLPADLLASAGSVLVMYIPFTEKIVKSNIKGEAASEDWAKAYVYTNELLNRITDELSLDLKRSGFEAETIKATSNFSEKTLMSFWSHRHFAKIAGLGSFGINNMLITSHGCCVRFTSLVTNASCRELGFTVSGGVDEEKCLNKIDSSACGLCLGKCPARAYTEKGAFDRQKCYALCLKNAGAFRHLGLADVCGKCLVGLPCSVRDPSQ